jgi:hypothetical protein
MSRVRLALKGIERALETSLRAKGTPVFVSRDPPRRFMAALREGQKHSSLQSALPVLSLQFKTALDRCESGHAIVDEFVPAFQGVQRLNNSAASV